LRSLAIYGKGGIGKSTLASNIASTLGKAGLKVLVVGCDPKCDSTINITGRRITPLLDLMKIDKDPPLDAFLFKAGNVWCVEIGGPEPGVGCAGRGIIVGVNYLLKKLNFKAFDFVIFDVPADIVCGGLAIVVKERYAEGVIIVTSDDFMSIYAANNICRGLSTLKANAFGILYNRPTGNAKYVEEFSRRVGLPIIGVVPYSEEIVKASKMMKTVIDAYPSSRISKIMESIASSILNIREGKTPDWLSIDELEEMFREDPSSGHLSD
jgi:nitrogenase iron protein NifH